MRSKKIKWLIYTVMVGLIPIVTRIFSWVITAPGTLSLFSPSDFIAFGLVLHISNINELEHLNSDLEWKTVQNGISILFISCYSVLFTASLIGGILIDIDLLQYLAIVLAVVSTGLSYSIYYHLERIGV